ncbi:MAG: hypothetical protein LEGION0403_FIIPPAGN_00660 [Legionella sp.]
MTVDSIPISELGQRDTGFIGQYTVANYNYGLGSDSFTSKVFIVCIYVYLSLIYERSHSRHAPLVLQPTSKPGRPQFVHFKYNIKYKKMGMIFKIVIKNYRALIIELEFINGRKVVTKRNPGFGTRNPGLLHFVGNDVCEFIPECPYVAVRHLQLPGVRGNLGRLLPLFWNLLLLKQHVGNHALFSG